MLFRQVMTVESDTLRLKIDRLFRQLISEVTGRGAGALSVGELDAVARGCSAYLALSPGDAAARKTADGIWSECRRKMDAAGDSCGAGPLGILLTMYALTYSAASYPADFSRAEQCDLAASRMLDAVLAASAGSDIFPNSDKWEQAMLMDLTAYLFQYVVPEDMEEERAVGVYRMTAAAWRQELSSGNWTGTAAEPLMMHRLLVLETGADLFGTWRQDCLPAPSDLSTTGGLSALVRILARRLDDPAALGEACAALERQLSLSPDISAAASLLEGLGALRMLTEEGTVLNCA